MSPQDGDYFAISFQKTENWNRQPANFLANGPASPLGLAEWNALNQRASFYTHTWMRYTNEPLYTITAARVRAAAVIYTIKTNNGTSCILSKHHHH